MSTVITGKYLGRKKFELMHGPSGAKLITDAPKDNEGEGTSFSPTDLFAASIGVCMTTVISIVAEKEGIDITGTHYRLEKHMGKNPRRIEYVPVSIHLPKNLTPVQRERLEKVGRECPVSNSISPNLKVEVSFNYDA